MLQTMNITRKKHIHHLSPNQTATVRLALVHIKRQFHELEETLPTDDAVEQEERRNVIANADITLDVMNSPRELLDMTITLSSSHYEGIDADEEEQA